jgi:N6-adenosine-specific RNA methylase IME4
MKQGARTDISPIGEKSQAQAAEILNVGKRSLERAKTVIDEGAPELVEAVEHGRVSVSAASDLATLPKQQQTEIVARGEKEILEAAKQIRAERAEVRKAELAIVKERAPSLPTDTYDVIVIDPPWDMQKIERDVRPNQVAFDYPTMSEEELSEFDVPSISADDCHLFCWTTHKFLPSALRLVEAWGFRYVMTMVWHKPGGFQPIGLPQYNCEFALYARKGSPRFVDTKSFFACFEAPRREHSRKPDEFYDVIRRVTDGRRIDVFSRENRDGFEQFGNEADKFSGAA